MLWQHGSPAPPSYVLIDGVERAEFLLIMGTVFDEMIAPGMIAPFQAQPVAEAVVEPQSARGFCGPLSP